MTAKEAIEALKLEQISFEGNAFRVAKFFEGLSVAIKALEKQIPKMPIIREHKTPESPIPNDDWWYECPCCGNQDIDYPEHHCPCGQTLYWEEDDETRIL